MSRHILLTIVLVAVALLFSVCGEKTEKPEIPEPVKQTETQQPAAAAEPQTVDEGVAVAEEILATFDKLVAEAAALAKDKPEPADLRVKLETLYKSYEEKMKELNTKYLGLKAKDIALFGSCNGYLGENRGKHVFDKDNALSEYISYYNLEKGDQEIVQLLSKGAVKLLDIAVQQQ
jgi:hypothetical protein